MTTCSIGELQARVRIVAWEGIEIAQQTFAFDEVEHAYEQLRRGRVEALRWSSSSERASELTGAAAAGGLSDIGASSDTSQRLGRTRPFRATCASLMYQMLYRGDTSI